MKRVVAEVAVLGVTLAACGCAAIPHVMSPADKAELRDRAIEVVKRAVRYKPLGSVRAQGVEVLHSRLSAEALPWLRNALHDDEPGVRFAAILSLGTLRDKPSYGPILEQVQDENVSLRVAAYYALHRLGDTRHSARLPQALLEDPSPLVRRDAAFALGLLGEPDAVKLLAKAMKDKDESVQQQALESMAMLGSPEAIQQLTFSASSGTGAQRLAALNALADLARRELENTFKYKLRRGEYIEIQLAAARGLGRLRNAEGLGIALRSLEFNSPRRGEGRDPPGEQVVRVRQLAAMALGAIGDGRALPGLRKRLYDPSDPHVQIAAAAAILEILDQSGAQPPPWRGMTASHRSGGRP